MFELYLGHCESFIPTKRWTFTMKEYQSLSHTRWDCKYRVLFIPEKQKKKKKIFEALRRHLGEIFRALAKQKESQAASLVARSVQDYISTTSFRSIREATQPFGIYNPSASYAVGRRATLCPKS
jgi:hypothetical protein